MPFGKRRTIAQIVEDAKAIDANDEYNRLAHARGEFSDEILEEGARQIWKQKMEKEKRDKEEKEEVKFQKITKKELRKKIKELFEDGKTTEKKRDDLMEKISVKDYEPVLKYLKRKGVVFGEGFIKGTPEAKAHAEKMRKAKEAKREAESESDIDIPKKSKGKIPIISGKAEATKEGKKYDIEASTKVNKKLSQKLINEGAKMLKDSADEHIKMKYFHPELKDKSKKYKWV